MSNVGTLIVLSITGAVAGTVALGCYEAAATAFALSKLYAWFAVPQGLPELSFAFLAGVVCAVRLLSPTGLRPNYKDTDGKPCLITYQPWNNWAATFLRPWAVLLVGWLIKVFAQ